MASSERSGLRAPLRRVALVLVVLLVAWLIGSVALLVLARGRAVDGVARLEDARDQLTGAALLRGQGRRILAAARSDFEAAHGHASSPVLAPWSIIPLASQNFGAVDALTGAAETVAAVGERTAAASADALRASPATGAERLALLGRLEQITARAERDLRRLDLGPDFLLVGPLGDVRDRFARRLDQLRAAVADARAVARGTEQLLTGPRRYLLLAANNAEMRAGSGMLLSAGVATFADGGFSIGEMRPTPDFNLPAGAVAVPPDLARLWGFLHPTQEWRNLATTPRFDVTAPLAAEMWRAATGEQVDGVLLVDPVTMQALLKAQGPIAAAGHTLTADDVVRFLLLDQYQGLAANDPAQAARNDALSAVARAAVDTLTSRPWRATDLVEQLSDVGRGRHVLAWARDPIEQRAWESAGINGGLRSSSLAVSLLNIGANKLDEFIHVDARLDVRESSAGGHEATVRLRIRNEAPTGIPGYVAGPDPQTSLAEGEYEAILAVNVPGAASLPTIAPAPSVVAAGTDGPTKVVAVGGVRLARGAEQVVTVRFHLPSGLSAVRVEPSARVPPITWHFRNRTWQDVRPERQEW